MRKSALLLGAVLVLSACNSGTVDTNAADMNADPNAENMMMTDENAALGTGPGGADMNTATDAATEDKMATDMNTNDKDTNLANGM